MCVICGAKSSILQRFIFGTFLIVELRFQSRPNELPKCNKKMFEDNDNPLTETYHYVYFSIGQNRERNANSIRTMLWLYHKYLLYFRIGQNRKKNQHCIRTMETECDLSNSLVDLKAIYSADVLSEPLRGVNSDRIEFPHTSSERFTPYEDSKYCIAATYTTCHTIYTILSLRRH